jgi:hypothetical protein
MPSIRAKQFGEPFPDAMGEVATVGVRLRLRLWDRMARECEAMAEHALGIGRAIPLEVLEQLDQALLASDPAAAVSGRRDIGDGTREEAIIGGAPAAETSPLASLSAAHGSLAQIVAPATPESILLTAEERVTHPLWYALGPLPIVRQMLGLAVVSLFVLLGVSLSGNVNAVNMSKTFLELEGYPLMLIEIFLLSASSLGSCFQNLQRINAVISEGTYDPKFQSTYWTRWVMGVISGIILSQLVYDILLGHGTATEPSKLGISPAVGEPLLALLGGYSVDVVHGILSRVVNTIGSLFHGPSDDTVENQARARLVEAVAQERLSTASDLVDLQRHLARTPEADELRKRLDAVIQRITLKAG